MTADAESQRVANVEGTREAVKLAKALDAKHFHMVSSIAAAGLYKGTFTEEMFEEAHDVENHPYFQTKHESEAVVRDEAEVPWRIYRPGHRRRPLRDRRDGQGRRALLLLQAAAARAQPDAAVDAGRSGSRARRSTSSRWTSSPRRWTTSPTGRARRQDLPPHRPEPDARRPDHQPVRPGRARARGGDADRLEDARRDPEAGALGRADAAAGEADHRPGPRRPRASRARSSSTSTTRPRSTPRNTQKALEGTGHLRAAAAQLRRQALGLLGAQPRSRPVQGPLPRRERSAARR